MVILCCTFLDGGARVFCDDMDGETILRIIQDYKVNLKRIQISIILTCPIVGSCVHGCFSYVQTYKN
jgi:hypothetical protein